MGEENYKHIVRVANVDIPGNKHVKVALRKIKGVNFNLAHAICNVAGVDIKKKAGSLTEKEVEALTAVINNPAGSGIPSWMFNRRKCYDDNDDKHLTEGKLGFAKENDIKRLKKIKCLRGIRHQKGLPVRGQRTKSNFRRSKGKTVGVKKKK